jgi:MarR family transcriptional regulator, organic hydroperoxide resistance regulator
MTSRQNDTDGLRDQTGYWLDRLRRALQEGFERRLAQEDVTPAQWGVLVALHRQEAGTPQELAAALQLDAGAITRLVDRLIAKGLCHRGPSPGERRLVPLSLTDKARHLVPRLLEEAGQNEAEFLASLDRAEQAEFRRLVAKLLEGRGIGVSRRWIAGQPAFELTRS